MVGEQQDFERVRRSNEQAAADASAASWRDLRQSLDDKIRSASAPHGGSLSTMRASKGLVRVPSSGAFANAAWAEAFSDVAPGEEDKRSWQARVRRREVRDGHEAYGEGGGAGSSSAAANTHTHTHTQRVAHAAGKASRHEHLEAAQDAPDSQNARDSARSTLRASAAGAGAGGAQGQGPLTRTRRSREPLAAQPPAHASRTSRA